MMKKTLSAVVALWILTGCGGASKAPTSKGSTASTESFTGDYYNMINTGRGTNSENFYLEFSNTKDLVTIGSGLQILSTSHYSTSSYYLAEGRQLNNNDLSQLLKRDGANVKKEDKQYNYTLQVEHGNTLDGVKDPIMVDNLTEQDYYKKSGTKYELSGLSFAIIIDPRTEDNKKLDKKMSDATIKSFSNTAIKKLYEYIQKKKKSLKDIPCLITIYQANDNEKSEINGNYIYQAYCSDGKVGGMSRVVHENVTFTSSRAKALDPTTYADFSTIKDVVKKSSTEAAGLVGEAQYINKTIQSMKITAHFNIKTYTELLYITSVLADHIGNKFTSDFTVKCLVYSQDKLMAVIIKNKGESAHTTIIEQ